MKFFLLHRNSLILLALVLLTVVSWFLAVTSQHAADIPRESGIAMLLLAFFKVRLIIRNFMEVRVAPLALKLGSDLWILAAALLTVSAYLGLFAGYL